METMKRRNKLTIRRLMVLIAVSALLVVTCSRVVPWARRMIQISEACRSRIPSMDSVEKEEKSSIEQIKATIKSIKELIEKLKNLEATKEEIEHLEESADVFRQILESCEKSIEDNRRLKAQYQRAIWMPWTLGR